MQPGPRRNTYEEAIGQYLRTEDHQAYDKETGEPLNNPCLVWSPTDREGKPRTIGKMQVKYNGKRVSVKREVFKKERYDLDDETFEKGRNKLFQVCSTENCVEPYHHDVKFIGG